MSPDVDLEITDLDDESRNVSTILRVDSFPGKSQEKMRIIGEVVAWLGGEVVSINFSPSVESPHGLGVIYCRIKISDENRQVLVEELNRRWRM